MPVKLARPVLECPVGVVEPVILGVVELAGIGVFLELGKFVMQAFVAVLLEQLNLVLAAV